MIIAPIATSAAPIHCRTPTIAARRAAAVTRQLVLKAFPPGALWRGSHQTAINVTVQAICIAVAAGLAIAIAGANGWRRCSGGSRRI